VSHSSAFELAFVALGANLGKPKRNVLEAINRLSEISQKPLLKSSLWETAPVDCPPGSRAFVNAVVGLTPFKAETPESLLSKLQSIEREFGRKPKKLLNETRPLDLDLITFARELRSTKELVLPHPRAHQRPFVLEPLNEIAPDLILPGQSKTVAELLDHLGVPTPSSAIRHLFKPQRKAPEHRRSPKLETSRVGRTHRRRRRGE